MTGTKYHNEYCNDSMTFEECEIAVLRHAVDESEKLQGQKIALSADILKIITIVEKFLIHKKLVCYGGTAINNILPKNAQFYNREYEVPDYDFFSPNAAEDAKELANIYAKEGFTDIEAKSGVHYGTFKVYVNFVPVADITEMHHELFAAIQQDSILRAGIRYAPPDYLRMSMYLELSRPAGDVSRWEKVLKRLVLLNKFYPIKPSVDCKKVNFQRGLQNIRSKELSDKIFYTVRNSFIYQGAVFFGGYASNLYAKYMPKDTRRLLNQTNPDFDVLSEDIDLCATIVEEELKNNGIHKVNRVRHEAIGEIIPARIELRVGEDTVAFIYEPIACHNYNKIMVQGLEVNVATIDTMLSFYLAFIYANEYKQFRTRILCMAKFLFEVEQHNRLEQRGVLKRFSMNCIGKQPSMIDLRMEKAQKFHELKRGTPEYDKWFMKYTPNKTSKSNAKESDPKESNPKEANAKESNAKEANAKEANPTKFLLGEPPKRARKTVKNIVKPEETQSISSFRRRLQSKRRNI